MDPMTQKRFEFFGFFFHNLMPSALQKNNTFVCSQIYMQFISQCLKELDNQKLSSIAFPGITSGFLKFPKNVASKNACRALAQYIDANPSTSLKEVRFVIHPEDNDTFKVKTGNDLVMRLQIKINGF